MVEIMELLKGIDELSVGDFVKVSQTGGKVSDRLNFTGKILQIYGEIFEVQTVEFIIGLSFNMSDIQIEVQKLKQRPNGWGEFKKNQSSGKIKPPEVITTRKNMVFDLIRENPTKKFNKLLSLAKDSIGGDEKILTNYIKLGLMKFRT